MKDQYDKEFVEDKVYPTRCVRCGKATRYQKYRYMAEDYRGLPCEFCKSSPPFLSYFVHELTEENKKGVEFHE